MLNFERKKKEKLLSFQFSVYCFHDEFSFYFDVSQTSFPARCFAPSLISRSSMASLNSDYRRDMFVQALDRLISVNSAISCVFVGESFLLPLLIVERFPQVELIIVESKNVHFNRSLKAIIENSSKPDNVKFVSSFDSDKVDWKNVSIVLSEPLFSQSILPWENLHFYYLIEKHREKFRDDCRFFPSSARFRCVALEFDNLHKIRSAVGVCRGFDLTPFDEQILGASLQVDEPIEPQPLFEYSSKKPDLSSVVDLLDVDFCQKIPEQIQQKTVDLHLTSTGSLNGIAFWIEYQLGEDLFLTTGLDPQTGKWVHFCKQGVHLLPKPIQVQLPMKIKLQTGFQYQNGYFFCNIVDDQQTAA